MIFHLLLQLIRTVHSEIINYYDSYLNTSSFLSTTTSCTQAPLRSSSHWSYIPPSLLYLLHHLHQPRRHQSFYKSFLIVIQCYYRNWLQESWKWPRLQRPSRTRFLCVSKPTPRPQTSISIKPTRSYHHANLDVISLRLLYASSQA